MKDYWRIINFGPAFFSVLQILLLLTVFRSDSPTELKKNKRDTDLVVLMRKCYSNEQEVQYRYSQVPGGDEG